MVYNISNPPRILWICLMEFGRRIGNTIFQVLCNWMKPVFPLSLFCFLIHSHLYMLTLLFQVNFWIHLCHLPPSSLMNLDSCELLLKLKVQIQIYDQVYSVYLKYQLGFSYWLFSGIAVFFSKKFQCVAFSIFWKCLFSVKETRVRSLFLSQNIRLIKLPSESYPL